MIQAQKPKLNSIYCFCPASTPKIVWPSDVTVSTIHGESFTDATVSPRFDITSYFSQLKTATYGRVFLYGDEVTSTQTILSELDVPPGTVFAATTQVQGKGRGENKWTSPLGALMFSFKCSLKLAERLPFLQYLVSLAVIETVKSKDKDLDVWIKWPNDIYTSKGVKIGGVLCQSSYRNDTRDFDICVGIGLNVSNKEPTTCLNDIASSRSSSSDEGKTEKPEVFSREWVLATFLNTFEFYVNEFEKKGFSPFQKLYLSRWLHSGQTVILGDQNQKVVIQGLMDNGYLRATDATETGIEYELHPDGNSFDFLKGLVISKVLKAPTKAEIK